MDEAEADHESRSKKRKLVDGNAKATAGAGTPPAWCVLVFDNSSPVAPARPAEDEFVPNAAIIEMVVNFLIRIACSSITGDANRDAVTLAHRSVVAVPRRTT